MGKTRTILTVCLLLLFILAYTAASKLFNFTGFTRSMYSQPLPRWLVGILIIIIPLAEIIATVFIMIPRMRPRGLWLTTGLMFAFTGYTIWIKSSGLDSTTCPCGGLFSGLNWTNHLIVNSILLTLSLFSAFYSQANNKIFHGRETKRKADASFNQQVGKIQ